MPIIHKCEPRSREWFSLRAGIPCSSEFHKILTPKTLKVSDQATGYLHRLLAEWVIGQPIEDVPFQSQYMTRGQDLEDEAVAAYELLTGCETSPGNFITTDNGTLGCSPDRLIGDVADLELKCLSLPKQIGYAINGIDAAYKCQVQGRLLIHEREYVDLFCYHPRFSIPPLRNYRDEEFIKVLKAVLDTFVEQMLKAREELEKRFGPFVRMTDLTAEGDGGLGVSDTDVDAILAQRQGHATEEPSE